MKKFLYLSLACLLCGSSVLAQNTIIQEKGRGLFIGTRADQHISAYGIDPPIVQPDSSFATRAALQALGWIATDGTVTATATAGAATLNKVLGTITTESASTAAAAAYTLTLTNSTVSASSVIMASIDNGTNSAGIPVVGAVTPGSGSVVIKVWNLHASAAFNGTLKIRFVVIK